MRKETLEDAAYRLSAEKFEPKHIGFMLGVIEGAKWQSERMYSEEEVTKLLISCKDRFGGSDLYDYTHDNEVKEWFESYKKK